MPFRIAINGVSVECDNAEEAFGLIDRYASSKQPRASASVSPDYDLFWTSLTKEARSILTVLAKSEVSLNTSAISTKAGISSSYLKYATRNIKAAAGKYQIPGKTLVRKHESVDGKLKSVYSIGEELKKKVLERII